MKMHYKKYLKNLFQFLVVCLLFITSVVTHADEYEKNDYSSTIEEIGLDIQKISDRMAERRKIRDKEIMLLKEIISKNEVSNSEKMNKIKELQLKINSEKKLINENDIIYKKITLNHKKYIFQTRMQKYIPIVYSLAALSYANKTDKSSVLLYGLAGYGTGAMIENTGYGSAALVTFFRYRF